MIETIDLSRKYGDYVAVDQVNLRIEDREIFGFLGLNGAGKTTVMRMICGLLRPTHGYSRVGNLIVRGPADTSHLIGKLSFISQEMKFHEHATLKELINIYAQLIGADPQTGMNFARQIGISLDRPCHSFSPGQQRKAQLAIALLKKPEYLLLDEPSAGLDPQGVAEMRDILKSLHASGTTIFFSSHILSEVQTLCTTVGILHRGKIRFYGKLQSAFQIAIANNSMEAALSYLSEQSIKAVPCNASVEVTITEEQIPALVEALNQHGIHTGLVKTASIEDTFQKIIRQE
jgi:ABC-2 type transport system ATP-binding protein